MFEGIDDLAHEHYLSNIFFGFGTLIGNGVIVIDYVGMCKLPEKNKDIENLVLSYIEGYITEIKMQDLGREVINKSKACPR